MVIYNGTFGNGLEVSNVENLLKFLVKYGAIRNQISVEEIAEKFQEFHKTVCKRLSAGQDCTDLIQGLINHENL